MNWGFVTGVSDTRSCSCAGLVVLVTLEISLVNQVTNFTSGISVTNCCSCEPLEISLMVSVLLMIVLETNHSPVHFGLPWD